MKTKWISVFSLLLCVMFLFSGCMLFNPAPSDTASLPRVKDAAQLLSLLKNANNQNGGNYRELAGDLAAPGAQSKAETNDAASPDFSKTNVQVEGVDEADIVKTDGTYLYIVHQNVVKIVQASPLKLMTEIRLADGRTPQDIYIADNRLVILCNEGLLYAYGYPSGLKTEPAPAIAESKETTVSTEGASDSVTGVNPDNTVVSPDGSVISPAVTPSSVDGAPADASRIAPDQKPYDSPQPTAKPMPAEYTVTPALPKPSLQGVRVLVYDISNIASIQLQRQFFVEGSLISSRRIENSLYLVSMRYGYYLEKYDNTQSLLPRTQDSAVSDKLQEVDASTVQYAPDMLDTSYMLVVTLPLNNATQAAHIETYLGLGQTLYASTSNLYIAGTQYEYPAQSPIDRLLPEIGLTPQYASPTVTTHIYKLALQSDKTVFVAKTTVPGSLINQFAMDEFENNLRVATTTGETWDEKNPSLNHIHIFDKNLTALGKVQNLAKGERIYSVRYVGNKGYMVTFRTTDPLFILDLSNPATPKVLGELKIPGFSEYLHPYDANTLLGFGREAVEAEKDRAITQGLKFAMFDVSNPANPKVLFQEIVGTQSTYSPLLNNHKALLFSKEKNLLGVPVMDYNTTAQEALYVYDITANGLTLRGKLSHMTNGNYYGDGTLRGLFIQDTLYTTSIWGVKSHKLSDLSETGSLPFYEGGRVPNPYVYYEDVMPMR